MCRVLKGHRIAVKHTNNQARNTPLVQYDKPETTIQIRRDTDPQSVELPEARAGSGPGLTRDANTSTQIQFASLAVARSATR
jgi:hypothetical protein